ncbi:MAG: M55 family metallopeptidase [Anaerolineae bacterium]
MNVYISADIEGINGVVSSAETEPLTPEWARMRKLMMGEVNAAVEGALAAGAQEILVNDSHSSMKNLMLEDLHPAATLLSGGGKMWSMMAGIDRRFDAVFFIGYHARAGSTPATIDHTYWGPDSVQGVWLNGIEVGESGLNGALAGYFGVPVALLTGDQTACAQAREFFGEHLETVVVKQAISRSAAINYAPSRVQEMIRSAAARTLARAHLPYVLAAPITLRVQYARSSQADRAEFLPDAKRIGPRLVEYTHEDYGHVFKAFYAFMILGDVKT